MSRKKKKIVVRRQPRERDVGVYSMTINDAVKRYSIGRTVLYRLMKEGHIKPKKLGDRTLIIASDIERYIKSLETA